MTDAHRRRGAGAARPPADQAKVPMREALAEAAFQLFLERGFEQTTVDDIVARAGVGRRSFFRYFPSKEDVVFPDHERCLVDMQAFLRGAQSGDPVAVVCDAAGIVIRMYAANPEFSVQRYHLTREVPGLRTYELSVVRRYERTLAGYLRDRYTGEPDGSLRAEVIAAAVVAAHNNALRTWLRSGGKGDAEAAVGGALRLVRDAWGRPPRQTPQAGREPRARTAGVPEGAGRPEDGDVVVMAARRGTPMWQVVQRLEAALDDDGATS